MRKQILWQRAFQLQERAEQLVRRRTRPPYVVVPTTWSWQPTPAARVEGTEAVLRCTMHEDCRQDANIGIACARDRMDQG